VSYIVQTMLMVMHSFFSHSISHLYKYIKYYIFPFPCVLTAGSDKTANCSLLSQPITFQIVQGIRLEEEEEARMER
jgi:hypothetical protein